MNLNAEPTLLDNESRAQYAIKQLRELYTWSDEIPDRILNSTDEDNKYKVRKAWWTAIILNLGDAIRYSHKLYENNTLIRKVYIFTKKYQRDLEGRNPTSKDIRDANSLLQEFFRCVDGN